MGSRQIRLDDDVYAKLADEKRECESFSDVIDRLVSDWSLAEWGGWLDEESVTTHEEILDELGHVDHQQAEDLLGQFALDAE